MTDADADGRGASAGGNACTAAALELHRALGTALTTARAPTAEMGASRDLVNLVNLVHAPVSDTLVIGSEYALHPDCTPIDLWHVSAHARAQHGALLPPSPQVLSIAGARAWAVVTLARLRRRAPERPPRRRYRRPSRRRRPGQPLRRASGPRPPRSTPLVYRCDARHSRRRMHVLTIAPSCPTPL